ncbi:MAG: universal stress protein [Desulfobacterales bacterium]|jgi:nucleotide-binding universal stress UspA family protein
MLPINKIVCPTDFSEPSYEGLKAAIELAELVQAELILLNVVSPVPAVSGTAAPAGFHIPTVMNERQAAAEKSILNLIAEKIPNAVQARSIVVQGRPADEIISLSDKIDADMIVIATHGESGWQKLLFGSVTEKVVRMASCPVLTVRQPKKK